MAIPSGIFCIPIPIASIIAENKSLDAKVTPIAIPSGILWIVIENISIKIVLKLFDFVIFLSRYKSEVYKNNPPRAKPIMV